MKNIAKAAVIGSGMMGPGIAVTLSLGGVEVTILSRTPEGATRAAHTAMRLSIDLADSGLMPQGAALVSVVYRPRGGGQGRGPGHRVDAGETCS